MKKKKKNPAIIILIGLFIVYLALFITQSTGYYELKRHNEMLLTKESMKQFEEDVKNGKDVSLSDYTFVQNRDYSSKVGDIGNKTSSIIESVMTRGIKTSFGVLGRLLS